MIHVWYRSNIWVIYVTYQVKSIVSQAFVGLLIFSDACEKCNSKSAGLVGLIMVGWFNQSTHLWSCAPPETYVKPQIDDFYEGWNSHFQVVIILGHNHLQFRVFGTREKIIETSQVLNGISSLRDCKAKCTSVCKPPNTAGPRWKLCTGKHRKAIHCLKHLFFCE